MNLNQPLVKDSQLIDQSAPRNYGKPFLKRMSKGGCGKQSLMVENTPLSQDVPFLAEVSS